MLDVSSFIIHLYILLSAGVDYEPFSEVVTFPSSSGAGMQCRDVTLVDDNSEENDETFLVQISDSSCQLIQTEATVTIIDDGNFSMAEMKTMLLIYLLVHCRSIEFTQL